METPPCVVCGLKIDELKFVYSAQHMLHVQRMKPTVEGRWDEPQVSGDPFWVCSAHHESDCAVLEVVKTGAAEQARLTAPPLVPQFWPHEVLSYDDLRK